MTKLYRENVATTGWFLPVVENFVLGQPEVENFVSSSLSAVSDANWRVRVPLGAF